MEEKVKQSQGGGIISAEKSCLFGLANREMKAGKEGFFLVVMGPYVLLIEFARY